MKRPAVKHQHFVLAEHSATIVLKIKRVISKHSMVALAGQEQPAGLGVLRPFLSTEQTAGPLTITKEHPRHGEKFSLFIFPHRGKLLARSFRRQVFTAMAKNRPTHQLVIS